MFGRTAKRTLGVWVVASCLAMGLWGSSGWAADSPGVVQVRLEVAERGNQEGTMAAKTRRAIADRAVGRIEKRLRAAQFKHVVVESRGGGEIFVEVGDDLSRQAVLGLLIPAGDFELRPVLAVGKDWQIYAPKAPEGVELRQPDGSINPDQAFVWSQRRSRIEEVAEDAAIEGASVYAYPHAGGWRSLTLGPAVLTSDSIGNAKIRPGKVGEPFVAASLSESANERLSLHARGTQERWAIVLDGEVVAVLDRNPRAIGSLNIPAPDHLAGNEAKLRWARQVAARLAAPIPPKLVPVGQGD